MPRRGPVWAIALLTAGVTSARSVPPPAHAPERAPPGPALLDLGPPVGSWVAHQLSEYQTGLAPFELDEVAATIEEVSERYGLSRDLILAVIRTESGFYNWARSRAGALGLMQIMPETGEMLARDLGIEWNGPTTLFDPVTNIRLGVCYLSRLHSRYGTWRPALAAYNFGPAAIDRYLRGGRTLPLGYTTRVLAALPAPTAP